MSYLLNKFTNLYNRRYLILSSIIISLVCITAFTVFTRSGFITDFRNFTGEKGELQILSPKNEKITDTLGVLATYKLGKGQKDTIAYLRVNNGTFRLIKYKKISDSEFLYRTSLNLQKLNPGTYSLSIFVVDITQNKPSLADTKTVNFEIKR